MPLASKFSYSVQFLEAEFTNKYTCAVCIPAVDRQSQYIPVVVTAAELLCVCLCLCASPVWHVRHLYLKLDLLFINETFSAVSAKEGPI